MTKRRNFSDKFKAALALEALREGKIFQEIAANRQLHHYQKRMCTNEMPPQHAEVSERGVAIYPTIVSDRKLRID